jgi:hypothetical protein
VGHRIQGVLVLRQPEPEQLIELSRTYGFRLFELTERKAWLLDLESLAVEEDDRAIVRAARKLAAGYVDALRVLATHEGLLEQTFWLLATAAAAHHLAQPVLGFVSDDQRLDFAAVATPDGIVTVGDRVDCYLLRWENGTLVVQPVTGATPGDGVPDPPEELAFIPTVTLLPTEELADGYPLHGNVAAEMQGFLPGITTLGIGTRRGAENGSLRSLAAHRIESSLWDRPAGIVQRH